MIHKNLPTRERLPNDVVSKLFLNVESRIQLCEVDLELFGLYYFREFFTFKTKDFHRAWYEIALSPKDCLIIGFRGSGKTAIFFMIYIIWCIVYKKYSFICLYCFDFAKAKAKAMNIVNILKINRYIKEDFGYLFKDNNTAGSRKDIDGMQEQKTIQEFVTTNGVKVKALSMGSSPRGEVFLNEEELPIRPELCQPKGNIVITSEGEKDISEIKKGDFVLSHKGKYKIVEDNWKTEEKNIYSIGIHGYSNDFTFSEGHKIYSKNYKGIFQRRYDKLEDVKFNEVESLKKGAYIGYPINYTEKDFKFKIDKNFIIKSNHNNKGQFFEGAKYEKREIEVELSKDDYYILGQFTGDGSVMKNRIVIYTDANKPEIIERIKSKCRFGINEVVVKNVNRIIIHGVEIERICRQIKIKGKNSWKIMPHGFEYDKIENQIEYIKGYIDSDGFIDYKNNCIRITSVHLAGLRQVQRILLRLNITSSIRYGIDGNDNYEIEGVKCKTQNKYDLYMRNGVEILGYGLISQTRYKYENLPIHIENGYLWSSIKSIEKKGIEKCYAFNVKDDRSYCNHLISNHNCIMDDIDVNDSVRNVNTIEGNHTFITSEIMGGIETYGKIIFLGNILGEDGVIPRFRKDQADNPNFIVSEVPLINEKEEIVWKEKFCWTDDEAYSFNKDVLDNRKHKKSLQSIMKLQGINSFNSNYRNKPYKIVGDSVFLLESIQKLKVLTPITSFNIDIGVGSVSRIFIFDNIYNKEPLVCGIDVGGGIGKDYTDMTFRSDKGKLVARWRSNKVKYERIAEVLTFINDKIGIDFYRNGLCIESNNYGNVILDRLRDNGYLYGLLYREKRVGDARNTQTMTLGFDTKGNSKQLLISDLSVAIDNGDLEIDEITRSELLSYIMEIGVGGKYIYTAQIGSHDDSVISNGLSLHALNHFIY